jgi:hypothetical protein
MVILFVDLLLNRIWIIVILFQNHRLVLFFFLLYFNYVLIA